MRKTDCKVKVLACVWVVILFVQLWLWGAQWALKDHSCAICEPEASDGGT